MARVLVRRRLVLAGVVARGGGELRDHVPGGRRANGDSARQDGAEDAVRWHGHSIAGAA